MARRFAGWLRQIADRIDPKAALAATNNYFYYHATPVPGYTAPVQSSYTTNAAGCSYTQKEQTE